MLKDIGVDFSPAWEDMYNKIVQYKAQNGDINITTDPILAAWMAYQGKCLSRYLQGESTTLNCSQAERLLEWGLQAEWNGVVGKDVASMDFNAKWNAKWNEMWSRLRDYKNEHGHCNVPTSSGTELSRWVFAQRRMYNELISGKPGKSAFLDVIKMQRLTELGFKFRPRGSYTTRDDQIKSYWKLFERKGLCRIPLNHPSLGIFVKLAQKDYWAWTQGRPSSMTPKRLAALKEGGFISEWDKESTEGSESV